MENQMLKMNFDSQFWLLIAPKGWREITQTADKLLCNFL